jgi:hypothetical protein
LNDASAGSPVAERLIVPPVFKEAAVMVKLIQVPATMVWFPGTDNVGGISVCTLTILLTVMLAFGEAESVTATLAV